MNFKEIFKQETEDDPFDESRRANVTDRYVNWLEIRAEALDRVNKEVEDLCSCDVPVSPSHMCGRLLCNYCSKPIRWSKT